ncbi:type I methionyl aminopeptidase [Suttonella ornithocola]|uniref:Methionine aminopeptidase n=1 Tax=Suttonella ornithocola TaxID=279832 RepID=A0A380MLC9_9GAMM|nr:type I methionyl aminopeptidase [Suttonella ornithocola]SUO93122.1 Methionine aminopeptidase [Suttonella ornithocola]
MTIILKTESDLEKMRVAGRLAADVLDMITPYVEPGVTTETLDNICAKYIAERGSVSACLNYGQPPYPKHTCISVNHVICHGIPSEKKLKKGDIVNIDVTVIVDGFHGDSSRMYLVGEINVLAKRLVEVTYDCMWRGIEVVKPGATLGDIGYAIQQHAEAQRFSVVREFCGHGIGRGFHEDPQILHYGEAGRGLVLEKGMTFTIEPMINAGKRQLKILPDGWTAVTKDHSLSAQWEHMLAVTETGYEIFTLSAKEREAGVIART